MWRFFFLHFAGSDSTAHIMKTSSITGLEPLAGTQNGVVPCKHKRVAVRRKRDSACITRAGKCWEWRRSLAGPKPTNHRLNLQRRHLCSQCFIILKGALRDFFHNSFGLVLVNCIPSTTFLFSPRNHSKASLFFSHAKLRL